MNKQTFLDYIGMLIESMERGDIGFSKPCEIELEQYARGAHDELVIIKETVEEGLFDENR